MYVEKAKTDYERAEPVLGYSNGDEDAIDITEDQPENKHRLAKRIADLVRVLRPCILISADADLFRYKVLANVEDKFHQATPKATIESLIDDVLRTQARAILLVGSQLDPEAVSRKTRRHVKRPKQTSLYQTDTLKRTRQLRPWRMLQRFRPCRLFQPETGMTLVLTWMPRFYGWPTSKSSNMSWCVRRKRPSSALSASPFWMR